MNTKCQRFIPERKLQKTVTVKACDTISARDNHILKCKKQLPNYSYDVPVVKDTWWILGFGFVSHTFKGHYMHCHAMPIILTIEYNGILWTNCSDGLEETSINTYMAVSFWRQNTILYQISFSAIVYGSKKKILWATSAKEKNDTSEFPAQKANNAESVSSWWRHHLNRCFLRARKNRIYATCYSYLIPVNAIITRFLYHFYRC